MSAIHEVRLRAAAVLVAVCCHAGCAGAPTDGGTATDTGRSTSSASKAGPTSLSSPSATITAGPGSSTRPSVPPSDEITGFWVLGTIGADSAGPCYEFRADDGRTITIYSSKAGSLTAGERIRARLITPVKPIYCGSIEALRLLETKRAT